MTTVSAKAHSIRNALAAARRLLAVKRVDTPELVRSGGEDGLYRCQLGGGIVVEVTLAKGARAEAQLVEG